MGDIDLVNALSRYTNRNSGVYDPIFDKYIREIRPDWFEDKVQIKKDQLIEIAKNGDKRPNNRKHQLGKALSRYTNKNNKESYDHEFDKKIQQLRPDWFENKAQIKKDQLIEMARNGDQRTKIGRAHV